MEYFKIKKFQISPYLAAISASVAILAGVWVLDRSEQQRFWQYNRASTLDRLSTVRSNLEGSLNSRLFMMRGLVAYISNNPNITEAEFAATARILLAQQTGIRSISLVKNTTIAYIYPRQGNEVVIGVDLLMVPKQRQMVEDAIETRKTLVAGPVKLLQGGVGFISRSPIFLTPPGETPEKGVYWGLASLVIDKDTLLQEAGLQDPSANVQYALRGKDQKGDSGEVFFGDKSIFQQDPVLLEVTLPSGSWQLAAIPAGGWPVNSPLRGLLLGGGGLLALLSGAVAFSWVYGPAKLRESEAKYRQLVENANSIIVQLDSAGNITFFNEFAETFFGYSEAEIIGKSAIGTLVSETDLSGNDLAAMIQDCLVHPKRYFKNENENIRRNGERVWIAWRNQPLLDAKGRSIGLLCVGTDISDRKQAEMAMQASESELRALFAAMNDVIFVMDTTDGRYLKIAPTNPELLYKPSAEVIGRTMNEILPPESADFCLSQIQIASNTKQMVSVEYSLPIGNRETWFAATISPMQENTVLFVARDITERKQSDSWLAGQKQILESIAKSAPLGETLNVLIKTIEQQSRGVMGSILLLDRDGEHLLHGAAPSLPDSYNAAVHGVAIGPNVSSCGTAIYRKEPVIVTDIATDPLWENFRDFALGFGLRACWSTPILSSQGQLLGTFAMYYPEPHTPTNFEIQLIEVATNVAGIAIESKQAEESLKKLNEELENRVEQRTALLSKTLQKLQKESIDRQDAQEDLRESESKFQKLAANLPGMIYQCLLSPDGPVSFPYVSAACRQMFELEPTVIQKNSALLIDLVHPEDRQNYYESFAVSAKNMQPWQWEGRLVLPSGKIRWFQVISRPEAKENGDILWDGITIDITDRKQAEAALQESQQFIQKIADATPGILYLYDLEEQRNVYTNSSVGTLLGYTFDEVQEMGATLLPQLIHPEDWSKFVEYHATFAGIQDGEVLEIEYRMRAANAQWFWLQSRDTIFSRNAENQPKMIIGFAQDITMRKTAEEALRQSEARERERAQQLEQALLELRSTQTQLVQTEKMSSLGQLVAGIAHEINNPVNFIHANIAYLKQYSKQLLELVNLYEQEYPEPKPKIMALIEEIDLDFMREDLIKIVGSMQVGTERIRQIVLSLRNFSRLDESEMKPVDIHAGIESTLLILQHRLKARDSWPAIQVVKDFGKLPLVECYASQLNQVFMNIIVNGIDAIEERYHKLSVAEAETNPGRISICTMMMSPKMVMVEISDNGTGIPEAVRNRIFNPFFTTKAVGKGTGLGMSISHSIVVEKHKGKIECISEIGRGTTFQIQIPIGKFDRQNKYSS
ncbi:MAG: PAS domain S-box protein [Microcoleus sp. CSU_2_2]|nr:PAS domain S-box protein [Microcoleus sp. CSU_2_2]